jgi:hypothetical protein
MIRQPLTFKSKVKIALRSLKMLKRGDAFGTVNLIQQKIDDLKLAGEEGFVSELELSGIRLQLGRLIRNSHDNGFVSMTTALEMLEEAGLPKSALWSGGR